MKGWAQTSYDNLGGWNDDDHLAALSCFRMSARALIDHAHVSRKGIATSQELLQVAKLALELDGSDINNKTAKAFFETQFIPQKYHSGSGFVTAYFEPEVKASRVKTSEYLYPIYRKPEDLVKLEPGKKYKGLDPSLEWASKTDDGLVEHYDRAQIDNGALEWRGLELFWLKSPFDVYYIQIQGSARLNLPDESIARVSYAGKSGHPYTSIGKLLVKRGIMSVEQANMVNIRKWLEADRERAMELLHHNRSYIFFTELKGHRPESGPIAAAGVQLTAGRSLAVDKSVHAYGSPIWISTHQPLPFEENPFQRLMIAQDTGSAIIGPQRGDLFMGSGEEAGLVAGSVRHDCDFFFLSPKEL